MNVAFDFAENVQHSIKARELAAKRLSNQELLDTAMAMVDGLEDDLKLKDREIFDLKARIASLEAQVGQGQGPREGASQPFTPQSWKDLPEWIDRALKGRLTMTPAARRMCRNPEFQDLAQVTRSLNWLATAQRTRRINGGGSLRDAPVENGLINAHCGSDCYAMEWNGRTVTVDWHIKNGGNMRDPKRCLRIYYFWDEATQMVVVDSLPSHRKTAMT